MKKYPDCENGRRNCVECSLSSYGRDCHNNKIPRLAWLRMQAGITQPQLAEKSGINIRQLQKYEHGELDLTNMTVKNAATLADALEIEIKELIR